MTKSKVIHTSGTRKRSVARLTLHPGKGLVRINGRMLDVIEPKLARMKLQEPLLLVGDIASKIHIDVNVYGGGIMSQVDAIRQAMGKECPVGNGLDRSEKIEQSAGKCRFICDESHTHLGMMA